MRIPDQGTVPMKLSVRSTLLLAPLLLASAPAAMAQAPAADAAAPAAQSEHDRLFALFAQANEATLERNPINAMFRGDMRYADRVGDFFSYETYADARQDALDALASLRQDRKSTRLNSSHVKISYA